MKKDKRVKTIVMPELGNNKEILKHCITADKNEQKNYGYIEVINEQNEE